MSRTTATTLLLTAALGLVGFYCEVPPREPRPLARIASALPGTCDGFLDYSDELRVSGVELAWMTMTGIGLLEAELRIELENQGRARFRSASAALGASDYQQLGGIPSAEPLPAEFGAIEPLGATWSSSPLRVQMPAQQFVDLMEGLRDGTIPLVVLADEETEFAAGVRLANWSQGWDLRFRAWDPNFSNALYAPDYEPPYEPGAEYWFWLPDAGEHLPPTGPPTYTGGAADGAGALDLAELCDGWDRNGVVTDDGTGTCVWRNPDETVHLTPGADTLYGIPASLHYVRILSLYRDSLPLFAGGMGVFVRAESTNADALVDLVENGSFCTGVGAHIDPPVQASRLFSIDGDDVDDASREGNGQPIRVNELSFGAGVVTFSGQIAGHVLKPSLSLRVREGRVETGAEFDTDLSFTAELRAEDEAELPREEQELYAMCFPLPNLVAGPVSIPMSLQIGHEVAIEGRIGAGAVIGFEKHFESGFSISCTSGSPGAPSSCSSEGRRSPTPIQMTPPQLTEATGFELRTDTTLQALLRLGSAHPECETGPGLSLETTAYAKAIVAPALDPWWSSAYGLETDAALEVDLLGLDIARYETELFSLEDGASSSDRFPPAPGAPGARSSGEDQRWAVAIDDTSVPNGVDTTSIAAFPDGSSITVASEAVAGRNPIVKLDRLGALVWVKEFGKKVLRVRALPDGTAVAVGSNAWLGRVDADGNLLWSFDAELSREGIDFARCVAADVAPIQRAPGVYDYVVVGRMGTTLVTTVDACAFRVNADGTLAWQRIYVGERGQQFRSAVTTQDGDIVAVGDDYWSYLGHRSVPLFVKLDAGTGDVVWWKRLPMMRLAGLLAVTEASDGTFYAVGNAAGTISSTGAGLVARIGPDGSDARHALLFQDEAWEVELAFESWTDTAGGDTAYDTYSDIAPSGDGFVVVGHTGLGGETAGRAAKVNAKLGVEWITTFDGASTDWLTGVAAADDGLFVSGFSASLPQAGGGNSDHQLWVMKLPFTGSLAFLPEVAMTTRYVAAGVRFSSADPDVNPLGDAAIDGAFSVEEALVVSAGENAGLLVAASPYCVELLTATGAPSTLDSCPE